MTTFMDRRRFLTAGLGLSTAGLLSPVRAAAARAGASRAAASPERRFLFVFCRGGWDTTTVFTPAFDSKNVDMEPDASLGQAHGLSFVDHPARPSVRAFFDAWGDRACILNGMEVRSVTHERCQRILMTGDAASGRDDWPAVIAAHSRQDLLLPHLVMHGTAYTSRYSSKVVRVGSNGQLPDLLDGRALEASGIVLGPAFAPDLDQLAEAHLQARLSTGAEPLHAAYAEALDTLSLLQGGGLEVSLDPVDAGCMRNLAADCASVLDCFELGLSRCGLVQYDGWCSQGFDTHAGNQQQSVHQEWLFMWLDEVFADLAARPSSTGGRLEDEVTVVVLSEMGRSPQLNGGGGRDHWTYTSAMLLGAGIRGGQVIGGLDEAFRGRPVDLGSGETVASGTSLVPGHLGATLLALADVDPGGFVAAGVEPIAAMLG